MEPANSLEGVARDARTLTEVIAELEELGYRGQFIARDGGVVECTWCRSQIAAADFRSRTLRRLEGASDPDEMMVVVGVECPVCNRAGTLVLGYGPEASSTDADVLAHLDDDG
jgi:hypothetical protein